MNLLNSEAYGVENNLDTSGYVASIVIPIRAKHPDEDGIARLERLLEIIPSEYEVLVVDDGSGRRARHYINKMCHLNGKAQYYYLPTRWKKFSLARSRNYGAWHAKGKVVIFHDVDFIGTADMYSRIANEIRRKKVANDPSAFFCIPVAFLTEHGSELYLRDMHRSEENGIWHFVDHPEEPSKYAQFIVNGSSCIVANKRYLQKIGGHDETYTGHGAEDFELLHRMSTDFPIAERPLDYAVNTGSGFIKEYRGFRAYFSLYGQNCRDKGLVLVHLWHPKRKGWGYYQHKRNFAKLASLMKEELG